jgi:hypothetical protein
VKDSTGALIPGATVTVVNKATNATRPTTTNEVGLFDLPALPPGLYTLKCELAGFRTATRDVELQVQQTARVNFTLELGTVSEMATVTGQSPLVETSNATIGTVRCENRRIVELPLKRQKLPAARRPQPERHRREFAGPASRARGKADALNPAAVDLGAAPRVQLLHAGRHR